MGDKLAHFGIFIHEAVDRFSEQIFWFEANSTNKNPGMIATHYLNTVQQLAGVPVWMRCNKGVENTITGVLQQYFRWHDDDKFAGSKSLV